MFKQQFKGSIAGLFEGVVRRTDGSIKETIPLQENLILNNGLMFLNGKNFVDHKGLNVTPTSSFGFGDALLLGTGSATPTATDIDLTTPWTTAPVLNAGINHTVENPTAEHPNHVVATNKSFFRVTNNTQAGVNLTELGLSAYTPQGNNRILFTHALIKDTSNSPTAITLLPGELLELNYYIKFYFDIRQQKQEVAVTTVADGQETTEAYTLLTGLWNTTNNYQTIWKRIMPDNWRGLLAYAPKTALDTDTAAWAVTTSNYAKYSETMLTKLTTAGNDYIAENPTSDEAAWVKANYNPHNLVAKPTNDLTTSTPISTVIKLSPYWGVHANGIRTILFYTPTASGYFAGPVTMYAHFFRKSDGAALMKTGTQVLEFTVEFLINRWDGN